MTSDEERILQFWLGLESAVYDRDLSTIIFYASRLLSSHDLKYLDIKRPSDLPIIK